MKYKYILSKCSNSNFYDYGGQFDHAYLQWALCGYPTAKGEVKQLSGFDQCRETLCCRIFDAIQLKKKSMPMDKLRIVVKIGSFNSSPSIQTNCQKLMDKWTKAAIHVLNIIEKEHKWGLTKAYPIKPYSFGDKVYMIVASKKWMRSPHMVSLFTLIFRIFGEKSLRTPSFMQLKSYKSVMQHIKEFSVKRGSDKSKVRASLKYWGPLLRNYSKMFRGHSMKDTFNRNNYRSHAEEGINGLCDDRCTNHKLQERFNKVVKSQKVLKECEVFDGVQQEWIVVGA